MPLAPAPCRYYPKRPIVRGGGVDRRFSEATVFSDYLEGDFITEQRQATPTRLTRAAKYSYNKKVGISGEVAEWSKAVDSKSTERLAVP